MPRRSIFGAAKDTKKRFESEALFFVCESLCRRLLGQRSYADERAAFAFLAERYRSVDQGEERMVFAHADILTGIVNRAALTDDDVARLCELAAEQFDTEPFAFRLTAVLRTTYTFLVCHDASFLQGLCNDFFHKNLRQCLPVSVAFLVSRAAFFLEHQDFVVFEVLQNLAFYRGAFYNRCADFDLTVVVCEQDFVETYGRIFVALKTVDIKFPTFFSLELLTCNLYYNVHCFGQKGI